MRKRKPAKTQIPKKEPKKESEQSVDSRAALLLAARKVFAQKGFAGATVKDLADEAKVNISLVSYYFEGKEGLYRSCLESFGYDRAEVAARILTSPISEQDFIIRLRLFGEDFVSIHLRDPEVCKLVHRGIETLDEVTQDVFKRVFIQIFHALENFLQSAQKNKILRRDIDIEITTSLVWGALLHMVRSQELVKILGKRSLSSPEFRAKVIDHWIDLVTVGIFIQQQKKSVRKPLSRSKSYEES